MLFTISSRLCQNLSIQTWITLSCGALKQLSVQRYFKAWVCIEVTSYLSLVCIKRRITHAFAPVDWVTWWIKLFLFVIATQRRRKFWPFFSFSLTCVISLLRKDVAIFVMVWPCKQSAAICYLTWHLSRSCRLSPSYWGAFELINRVTWLLNAVLVIHSAVCVEFWT